MKERPILFSAPMVRAILAGAKTQTRRVVKNSSGLHAGRVAWDIGRCPYGRPGDRLWVRESMLFDPDQGWRYSADGADVIDENYGKINQRCPSIHMPRCCCRILLEITDVRVERLQDISEADAIAEGVKNSLHLPGGRFARENFAHLWWTIHGDGSWEANPLVWVVNFRQIEAATSAADSR